MEAEQIMEGASPQVENRVATPADLRAFMNSFREEMQFLLGDYS